VFLTTATTVLGLAPLLYEQSQQAQFLKPTVITLVYGLGFGMFIVLLIVPALLAMQQDVGKQIAAVKRALRGRAGGQRVTLVTGITGLVVAALFAVTMGAGIVQGSLPAFVLGLLPASAASASVMPLALGVFVLGTALVVLASYVVSVVVLSVTATKQSA
jgi:hypothetical protein